MKWFNGRAGDGGVGGYTDIQMKTEGRKDIRRTKEEEKIDERSWNCGNCEKPNGGKLKRILIYWQIKVNKTSFYHLFLFELQFSKVLPFLHIFALSLTATIGVWIIIQYTWKINVSVLTTDADPGYFDSRRPFFPHYALQRKFYIKFN